MKVRDWMRIRDYGDRALLLECGSGDEVLALAAALRRGDIPGIGDHRSGSAHRAVDAGRSGSADRTAGAPGRSRHPRPGRTHRIVTRRRGDRRRLRGTDLTEVAALTGLTAGEVVEAHTGTPWRVGFGGFAPGFAYLVGGDPRLQVPRRAEPRVRVPAGSVALAGEFSGVYPRESPGGWQLIGRTGAALWDVDRPQPALLVPGMWVRFRAVASGPAEQP